VLTVVNDFSRSGMLIGRGSASHIGASFEERDPESGIGKSAPRSQSGQSATYDGYGGRLFGKTTHAMKFSLLPIRIPATKGAADETSFTAALKRCPATKPIPFRYFFSAELQQLFSRPV
jgi:hypothetical protein